MRRGWFGRSVASFLAGALGAAGLIGTAMVAAAVDGNAIRDDPSLLDPFFWFFWIAVGGLSGYAYARIGQAYFGGAREDS
jgi:hypothetical protein